MSMKNHVPQERTQSLTCQSLCNCWSTQKGNSMKHITTIFIIHRKLWMISIRPSWRNITWTFEDICMDIWKSSMVFSKTWQRLLILTGLMILSAWVLACHVDAFEKRLSVAWKSSKCLIPWWTWSERSARRSLWRWLLLLDVWSLDHCLGLLKILQWRADPWKSWEICKHFLKSVMRGDLQ